MSQRWRDGLEYFFLWANILLVFCFYNAVARLARSTGIDLSPWVTTRIDLAIPFDLTLFPVYMSGFTSSSILMLGVFLRAGIEPLRRFFLASLLAMLVSYVIYVLLPVCADPLFATVEPMPGSIPYDTLRSIPLYSSLPSMHVTSAWMTCRLFCTYYPSLRFVNLAFFLAMAVSTLTLKLHFLADVVTGWALGEAFYRCVHENPRVFESRRVRGLLFSAWAPLVQGALFALLVGIHMERGRQKRLQRAAQQTPGALPGPASP